jgi:hypothetical protein
VQCHRFRCGCKWTWVEHWAEEGSGFGVEQQSPTENKRQIRGNSTTRQGSLSSPPEACPCQTVGTHCPCCIKISIVRHAQGCVGAVDDNVRGSQVGEGEQQGQHYRHCLSSMPGPRRAHAGPTAAPSNYEKYTASCQSDSSGKVTCAVRAKPINKRRHAPPHNPHNECECAAPKESKW